jgi:phosphoribosylanthranilate isomerase
MIFAKQSPRCLTVESARSILGHLPENTRSVGVFVDPSLEDLERAIYEAGVSMIQIHGNVPGGIAELSKRTGIPYLLAIAPRSETDLSGLRHGTDAFAVVVDAYSPNKAGGTGQLASWPLAIQAKALHPKIVLAGGLNIDNVASAIREVQPYAVDLSSGLESAPGKKDHEKLNRFFDLLEEIQC